MDLDAVPGRERTDFRRFKTRHDQGVPLGNHQRPGFDEEARQLCYLWTRVSIELLLVRRA